MAEVISSSMALPTTAAHKPLDSRLSDSQAVDQPLKADMSLKSTSAQPSAFFTPSERYLQLAASPDAEPVSETGSSDATRPHAGEGSAIEQRVADSAAVILGFLEDQLQRDQAQDASVEQLQARLQAGVEGIYQGFSQASEELSAMGLMTDAFSDELQQTLDQVLQGVTELQQAMKIDGSATKSSGPDGLAAGETAAGASASVDVSTLKAQVARQVMSQTGLESLLQYLEDVAQDQADTGNSPANKLSDPLHVGQFYGQVADAEPRLEISRRV